MLFFCLVCYLKSLLSDPSKNNRPLQGPSSSRQFSRGQPESLPNINSPPPLTSNPDPDDDDSHGNSGADFTCPKSDGLFADPNNCRKFNLCGNWRSWSQTCPPSLYFDAKLKYCTFKTDQLTCGPIDEAEVRAEERELSQDALPPCVLDDCRLPNCFCTNDGTLIPANIPPSQTPQMVLISFSGALNDLVYDHYRRVLGYGNRFNSQQSRRNPNGCGIRATFFINHEYSNYAQIQWFAAQGHEMAVHSITHRQPETWWTDHANYSEWAEEMIGMREIMIANAGGTTTTPVLTRENIVGMRAPYIRPGGNSMFEMAHDFGFLYDSSIAAPRGTPPYWPFTYDYRQPFDCSNQPKKDESRRFGPTDDDSGYGRGGFGSGRGSSNRGARAKRQTPFLGRPLKCPTRSFPGLWEVPINPLYNEFNTVIMLINVRNVRALNRFLDHIQSLKDVWFVTFQQMLSWVRNPKPASESSFPCENNSTVYSCSRPHTCVLKHYLNKDNSAASEDNYSRTDTRYMPVCHSSLCPQQYQWYGNTAGRKRNFKTIMQLIEENPPPSPSESVDGSPIGVDGQ
ncbi:Cda4p, variant 2 [Dermatophagoides farinae]|uniref:Cda4p, variant 2 n=1 Tax=Dermatophagoides farinae TaxID=6954 RepID=A0A922HYW1_DERFA|nr:Cda4p, variant 2 [Dermatophagoides farinae]